MIRRPGKRETLSRWLHASGAQFVLRHLPRQSGLLVLNYHRVGDAAKASYDSQVFTATAGDFECQMEFVARNLRPATLREALDWVEGSGGGFRTLITFDDGYL